MSLHFTVLTTLGKERIQLIIKQIAEQIVPLNRSAEASLEG